jgi:DNA invertase Pin-like site-specific DNA recombinase
MNVALVATSQGIGTNLDSPAGRLQMHMLMAVAQFERSLIGERVRAGQAGARAKGVKSRGPGYAGLAQRNRDGIAEQRMELPPHCCEKRHSAWINIQSIQAAALTLTPGR